jgi:hypothetical protein
MTTTDAGAPPAPDVLQEPQRRMAEVRRGGVELERNGLRAVHERDLLTYARSLGIYDQGSRTVGRCKFCGDDVSIDHVAAVFPLGGAIKVACDKSSCRDDFLEAIRQQRIRL